MFLIDTLPARVAACLVVVISPGPDNLLAISRGLRHGRLAGGFASSLARWLQMRPKAVKGLNIGAGPTLMAAGLSVLSLKQRNPL